jgi:V8-like Glu-specific endopeptidase
MIHFILAPLFTVTAGGPPASAPSVAPLPQRIVAVELDSGPVSGGEARREAVWSAVLRVSGAPWLRLVFEEAVLGSPPAGGTPTLLRLRSLRDGASQIHTDGTLHQWGNTSAYFNGDAVRLEIVADPGAAPSRLRVRRAIAGIAAAQGGGSSASICGPDDDRVPSSDPRVGRAVPVGCTAWLIHDACGCMLTAGHCATPSLEVIEFDVPPSDAEGNVQHPGPEDQYAVDPASVQSGRGEIGQDWAYFGCFANTETGLSAGTAQEDSFQLAPAAPAEQGQSMRVTGHGTDMSPPQDNFVQQTDDGPYLGSAGTILEHQADTTGGCSGSPVIDESTGLGVGIHTHGGCGPDGGANRATAIDHPDLQAAMSSPLGVCCLPDPPPCAGDCGEVDGNIGIADLLALLGQWGGAGTCDADGGGVGITDLLALLARWGPCP